MLRTKKKQLNLKPNRVLDKRSSRGMLYENEELRLRTIHINDEVEKGHHDIKKLRKENEYLKREIWSLRDECEKLEEVIKKVYAGDPPPPDELPTYQPHIRKHSTGSTSWNRRGSSVPLSNYGDNEEDEDRDEEEDHEYDQDRAFYPDEETSTDPPEMTTSGDSGNQPFYEAYKPLQRFDSQPVETTEISSSDECAAYKQAVNQSQDESAKYLHEVEEQGIGGDEQEAFSSVHSVQTIFQQPIGFEALSLYQKQQDSVNLLECPSDDIRFIDSNSRSSADSNPAKTKDESQDGSKAGIHRLGHENLQSDYKPVIEITPASSRSSANFVDRENNQSEESLHDDSRVNERQGGNIYDLGCVTEVPKKYQVTSELKIGVLEEFSPEKNDVNFQPNPTQDHSQGKTKNGSKNDRKQCQCHGGSQRVRSFHSDTLGRGVSHQNVTLPFYQSEPSLSSGSSGVQESHHYIHRVREANQKWESLSRESGANFLLVSPFDPHLQKFDGFHGFDSSIGMCGISKSAFEPLFATAAMIGGWNCVDKNVVIGFLDDAWNNQEEFTAQEVIDELEAQFDPTLEKVTGVRMLVSTGSTHGRIFISFRQPQYVKALVENGLQVRQRPLKLLDANSTPTVSILLIGLPSSVPDGVVISVLNQFGQVIAPLERRMYKGVDISERFAKMHLVKPFPQHSLSVAGYEVIVKLLQPSESAMAIAFGPKVPTLKTQSHHDLFQQEEAVVPTSQTSNTLPSFKQHKPVTRSATLDCSTSLTPNPSHCISANMGPTAAAIQKRKMSVCSAVLESTSSGNGTGANKTSPHATIKKPLQRFIKTPVPTQPPVAPQPLQVEVQQEGQNPPVNRVMNRSLSFDPKKIAGNVKAPIVLGSEQSLTDSLQSNLNQRVNSIRGIPISRQPSRLYQGQRRSSATNNNQIVGSEKKEPLPWCGCWGNGCV